MITNMTIEVKIPHNTLTVKHIRYLHQSVSSQWIDRLQIIETKVINSLKRI